jgi:hypothetical protein
MPLIHTCTVADPRFGIVVIHTDVDKGTIEITGDTLPTVHLRRIGDPPISPYVPIGTRRAEHLTLSVDGSPGTISPGRGGFTRGSFRVDAMVDDVRYRLTPSDTDGSALLRDGKRLGELMLEPETIELMAIWADDAHVQPRDAAVGYALATAFGTGAKHTLVMLLEAAWGIITGGHSP